MEKINGEIKMIRNRLIAKLNNLIRLSDIKIKLTQDKLVAERKYKATLIQSLDKLLQEADYE